MGFAPPPAPLGREEFERRYRAGARTMEQLDPDLCAWRDSNRRFRRIAAPILLAGLVALLTMAAIVIGVRAWCA